MCVKHLQNVDMYGGGEGSRTPCLFFLVTLIFGDCYFTVFLILSLLVDKLYRFYMVTYINFQYTMCVNPCVNLKPLTCLFSMLCISSKILLV